MLRRLPHTKKKVSTGVRKTTNKEAKKSQWDILASNRYVFIIITLVILITYSGSFKNDFVFFDDTTIMENIEALKTSPIHIFTDSFKLDAMAGKTVMFYRPFQTFILIALSFTGGFKSYICFLLFLHILNASLIFYLLTLFSTARKKSLLLALLFSVHPLFAPVINWIPAIGDATATFFLLISVIFFIKFTKRQNTLFLIIHLLAFFFAVISKEITILFPFLCFLYLMLFKGTDFIKKSYKQLVALAIGWICIPLLFLLLRNEYLQLSEAETIVTGLETFVFNIPVLFQFIFKFFFPVKLSLISMNSLVRMIGGVIIFAALIYSAFKQGNNKQAIFFSAWFALFLIPTLIFDHPRYDYLEHRGYLPLISMVLFLSSIRLYKHQNILLLIVIPLFCFASVNRTENFSDPIRFYNSVIKNEEVAMAYNNLAIEKSNILQDFQSALIDFNKAAELDPAYADAYVNRGNLKAQKLNNFGGAISDYQKAIELIQRDELLKTEMMDYADIYNNMGTAKFRLNDGAGALADYNKAIELKPDFAEVFFNRGILKSEVLHDYDGAIEDFSKAIEIEPTHVNAYTNRGVIKELKLLDYTGALADYNNAIRIKPDFAMALYNRGMFYKGQNNLLKACADWQMATNFGHQGAAQMLNSFCK